MRYLYSQRDKDNSKWFGNDYTRATLRKVALLKGGVRGLKKFTINFEYPIAAIAGKNGSGKSTLLAMIACAYHNKANGYSLPDRKQKYYTFSDFFIVASGEFPVEGVSIRYDFMHDKWRAEKDEDKTGIKYQLRNKNKGGKWNDYDQRVKRNVLFFGINRFVPHAEKSTSKSYKARFKSITRGELEEVVLNDVAFVLGLNYSEFEYRHHSGYRLPVVKNGEVVYSGFNMGAGENSLFDLLYHIHACPDGSIVLVDEIELGLHGIAQRNLMQRLKDIAFNKKMQFIFTTHSPLILEAIPPESRYFIESGNSGTLVKSGISSEFAAGRLGEKCSGEITIYVEDNVAKSILIAACDSELRSRTNIVVVGSSSAVITQMSASRKDHRGEVFSILDGDKSANKIKNLNLFESRMEVTTDADKEWFSDRIDYLPSVLWPEKWIVEQLNNQDGINFIMEYSSSTDELVRTAIQKSLKAKKHSEIYDLSKGLLLDESEVDGLTKALCRHVVNINRDYFNNLLNKIKNKL
ncbi:ATP-binding protein [Chitinibacter bivalviorum]|uniref:ATP-binding protein n=1 Tax=Chitinibacter bivalviorum TaxID=2739434 RepID=A0A7H9BI17_9NEIS|nr:ATP-binding protein [Chitinibacter bivalviorum]QLG87982.1 ATP-binding protein [Chitinibacter bivalviorum]